MAITVQDLAVALRIITDTTDTIPDGQQSVLARLLGVAEAHVDLLAPAAPTAVQDEAVIRMSAYLFDVPPGTGRRDSYANSWVNSGAGALVSRWAPQAASATAATDGGD